MLTYKVYVRFFIASRLASVVIPRLCRKADRLIGIELSPHALRRHTATYASKAEAPIEIVSKMILRHANLSTTQRYLGKVSDDEVSRWVDNIFS